MQGQLSSSFKQGSCWLACDLIPVYILTWICLCFTKFEPFNRKKSNRVQFHIRPHPPAMHSPWNFFPPGSLVFRTTTKMLHFSNALEKVQNFAMQWMIIMLQFPFSLFMPCIMFDVSCHPTSQTSEKNRTLMSKMPPWLQLSAHR